MKRALQNVGPAVAVRNIGPSVSVPRLRCAFPWGILDIIISISSHDLFLFPVVCFVFLKQHENFDNGIEPDDILYTLADLFSICFNTLRPRQDGRHFG